MIEGAFSISTWNVNSVRVRGPQVREWLVQQRPSVLALQELKLPTEEFPAALFEDLGYAASAHGQKTYNGVALLSREPPEEVTAGVPFLEDDPQARGIEARWGAVRVINLYVPNGESTGSEKYAYKLRWLERLADYLETHCRPEEFLAVVGDFNIAPEAVDIYDPERFREQVLFSEAERAALRKLLGWGLVDLFRALHPETRSYSWWDYRQAAFRRNLGARIDLILVTPALAARALACEIDPEPRRREKPSDHTPVWAAFGEIKGGTP